ncbi:MAG TPA: hypothetical protein VD902_20705, partial [Symbiobacteriaceae bacterium]|nr:hypothetical protein [Symbiobacteriaceae bacterium]
MNLHRMVAPKPLTMQETIPYLAQLADADWIELATPQGALVVEAAARVLAIDLQTPLSKIAAVVNVGAETNLMALLKDVHAEYLALIREFREHGGRAFPFYRKVMWRSMPWRLARSIADEAVILGVLARVAGGDFAPETPQEQLAFQALVRSTTALPDDATPEQASQYLQQYDDDQLAGIATNLKGIYHELAWEHAVNHDTSPDSARLFGETNHPGTDALYTDDFGDTHEVSLKTGDVDYVRGQVAAHPDIRFVVNDEAYRELHARYPNVHLESSGLDDAEMEEQVEELIQDLRDEPDAT